MPVPQYYQTSTLGGPGSLEALTGVIPYFGFYHPLGRFVLGEAGGGGDPYFFGFDEENFEFHGEHDKNYLLFENESLLMNIRVIEAIIQCKKGTKSSTFIDGIWFKFKDKDNKEHQILYSAYFNSNVDKCGILRKPFHYNDLNDFLPVRCFSKDFIKEINNNNWRNFEIFELNLNFGKIILSRCWYAGQAFVNFLFKSCSLNHATGIIGQTLMQHNRLPFESFEIPTISYQRQPMTQKQFLFDSEV